MSRRACNVERSKRIDQLWRFSSHLTRPEHTLETARAPYGDINDQLGPFVLPTTAQTAPQTLAFSLRIIGIRGAGCSARARADTFRAVLDHLHDEIGKGFGIAVDRLDLLQRPRAGAESVGALRRGAGVRSGRGRSGEGRERGSSGGRDCEWDGSKRRRARRGGTVHDRGCHCAGWLGHGGRRVLGEGEDR